MRSHPAHRSALALVAATLLLPLGSAQAANRVFDLKVHAYCLPPAEVPPGEGLHCGFNSEQELRANIVQKIADMNQAWCYNDISFRHHSTEVDYDAAKAQPSLFTHLGMALLAENEPQQVHMFVLHLDPAGHYSPPRTLVVAPWLDAGGWAHEMGHYFGLPHTFTWDDTAETGEDPPDRDYDGLFCTTGDPGLEEVPPRVTDRLGGVLKPGHEYCTFTELTSPPVDPGSPKPDYCSFECFARTPFGTFLSASGVDFVAGDMNLPLPPPTPNAMAYFPGACKGPYVLHGFRHNAFCYDQRTSIWDFLATTPERQQLVDVCPGSLGGDPDCDGICHSLDNCKEVANPGQVDSDNDGDGNACDPCPHDPLIRLGAPDKDGDGIGDACDIDIDNDGCPQICLPLDNGCCGPDEFPLDDKRVVGSVYHPRCPEPYELIYAMEWEDSDGDGICNCGDPDDDNDGVPDADDPCPIDVGTDPELCNILGVPCPPEIDWWAACLFGGCFQFDLLLNSVVNPDPTQEFLFEDFEAVAGVIYLRSFDTLAPSEIGGLFVPAEDDVLRLSLVDPSGEAVATLAEWNSLGLNMGNLSRGTMLALEPQQQAGARVAEGLNVGATYAAGALPGTALRDSDGDRLPDIADNCLFARNDVQLDSDGDGFGDACDADFDNDGVVGPTDVQFVADCHEAPLGAQVMPYYDAESFPEGFSRADELLRQRCWLADLNDDGIVCDTDHLLVTEALGQPPGPSGLAPVRFDAASRIGVAGEPLSVDKTYSAASGQALLVLEWGPSCAGDNDYEVYEGLLGEFDSHVPRMCSTEGVRDMTFVPDDLDAYYIVVPAATFGCGVDCFTGVEGSYGLNSEGDERPQGLEACREQAIRDCP